MKKKILIAVLLVLALAAYFVLRDTSTTIDAKIDVAALPQASEAQLEAIAESFILAKKGDVIEIPEGYYEFSTQLYLDKVPGVTIKGAGMDKTVLSFKNLTVGAEGIKISADSVLISSLTVQDTPGDNIKIQNSKGVTLQNVRTTWSQGPAETNGGYGIYPVTCQDVLIENCEVSGASDAGIYVGQSRNIVVRNNYVFNNVAGIEIENCINSEVYKNLSTHNTGGILVFDLPSLPAGNGHTCKVYDNEIIENNYKNFAPEGNIVGTVPPGTGIILLAAKNVEIYNNKIVGHKTMGTAISSYQTVQTPWNDANYDPFTYDVYIHDNSYHSDGYRFPDYSKDFGKLVVFYLGAKAKDIVYDGILDDKKGTDLAQNPMNLCIQNQDGASFAMIDAANDLQNISDDPAPYDCTHTIKTDVSALQ
ncbi:parallel beta-helix domain-containing protein [Sediminicola luteus]|uniref:Right handed beta helix domain-containing protein n=1 Tax=Sediminicola luteus TaxID=319238 RepID=A0A2A4GE71_9FLAO|nr:parallel beta-helix domain-containing protein [Sediminicola luteus]PCE66095.1 hypothetical protein B7P33_02000 [Sediminicola luteus]